MSELTSLKTSEMPFTKSGSNIIVSAPGRADFLNTHQDYKGLPVVPTALNLRTYISAEFRNDDVFEIRSLDFQRIGEPFQDQFSIGKIEYLKKGWFGNYFRAIVKILEDRGLSKKLKGMRIHVKSQVPVASGLASSAALEVAFATLLDKACKINYNQREIAELAYEAENVELSIPCGRLDQYGSTFGGILKLDCKPPYKIEKLPIKNLIFVIHDSGVKHSTAEIHPLRQKEISDGLKTLMESDKVPSKLKNKLGYNYDEPDWENIREEEIGEYLNLLYDDVADRFRFTLRMQRSTEIAIDILKNKKLKIKEKEPYLNQLWNKLENKSLELEVLGEIMNYQHELLKELYKVSIIKLEKIRDATLEAGAYGTKISGAGMGGSLISLVDPQKAKAILEAGIGAGAKQGWISGIGEEAKIH
ncbi:MAG: GHMP family kinase ATP-binding protein [Candidatus Jordarchaeum sp.]|uniref:GHMP family kinase ATP-binding protein n=1 Tax=Candidatus Jordarchaeum sp. TaxID=2823881 RepID=UPI00404B2C17